MILLIYNERVCREVLLPNVYDTDYRVRLHKSVYSLQEDITLEMERSGPDWTMRAGRNYKIYEKGHPVRNLLIRGDQILQLHTRSKEVLIIMTVDVPIAFHVMEKYDISITPNLPYPRLFSENHNSWTPTYKNEYGIMSWLLNQVRED